MNTPPSTPAAPVAATPRTDAEAGDPGSFELENHRAERLTPEDRPKYGLRLVEKVVPADFARQLERDLAARDAELATLRERHESNIEWGARIAEEDVATLFGKIEGEYMVFPNDMPQFAAMRKGRIMRWVGDILCKKLYALVDERDSLRSKLQTATERAELERNMRITMETRDGDKLAAIVGLRSDLAALRAVADGLAEALKRAEVAITARFGKEQNDHIKNQCDAALAAYLAAKEDAP